MRQRDSEKNCQKDRKTERRIETSLGTQNRTIIHVREGQIDRKRKVQKDRNIKRQRERDRQRQRHERRIASEILEL